MQKFERNYALLVSKILARGEKREGRNGVTTAIFGEHLKVHLNGANIFPILQNRKMYPNGVFGEFAALVRKPKHVNDFVKQGCNYWDQWADESGNLKLDYGNAWFNFNGVDQIAQLKDKLKNNPTDRRMIVTGWKPDGMDELSLPCCHHTYQFYVTNNKYLNLLWMQRSVDVMVGLPSDIILAATWCITLANEMGLTPGELTFSLGDCHIYEEHQKGAREYLYRIINTPVDYEPVEYKLNMKPGQDFCEFKLGDIALINYTSNSPINFKVKA